MKDFIDWAKAMLALALVIAGLIFAAKGCQKTFKIERFEGYLIGPNRVEWIWIEEQDRWSRKEIARVFLSSGELVEAEIIENSAPYCLRYSDYPPAKGKKIKVFGEKNENGYFLYGGCVEE